MNECCDICGKDLSLIDKNFINRRLSWNNRIVSVHVYCDYIINGYIHWNYYTLDNFTEEELRQSSVLSKKEETILLFRKL